MRGNPDKNDIESLGQLITGEPPEIDVSSFNRFLGNALSFCSEVVKSARVVEYPTPHVFATNVFPSEFYTRLLRSIDLISNNFIDISGREDWQGNGRHSIFHSGDAKPLLKQPGLALAEKKELIAVAATLNKLTELQKVICHSLRHWIPELADQKPLALQASPFLKRDYEDFSIEPHTESFLTVATAMFYVPSTNEIEHAGTALLEPNDSSARCFAYKKMPYYPEEDFKIVKILPFKMNSFMAFAKTPQSWHSRPEIGCLPYPRDSITINFLNPQRASDGDYRNQLFSGVSRAANWRI